MTPWNGLHKLSIVVFLEVKNLFELKYQKMARKRINRENCYTFLATWTRTGYYFQFPLVFHNNVNERILYYNFFPSQYDFKLLLRRIITPYTLGLISSTSFSYKFNTGRQGKRAEEKITKKKYTSKTKWR